MGKEIVWTNHAIADLNKCFLDFLEESESIETTVRIFDEIHESVDILSTHPEIYKLDNLKKINKGNTRAYEKHSFRISYQVEKEKIFVIRIGPARKEPLDY